MMRSMYAAVVGLRNHQTRMDVIGDNIANVNTVGFKRARVTFQDMFYQTLQGGSAGDVATGIGGTNPKQIGLGVSLGSIDVIHTQGAPASSGNGTDLTIQGDGFFVLTDDPDNMDPDTGANLYYTRAGAFTFDSEGYLVNPANGMYVLDTTGNVIQVPTDAENYNINAVGEVVYLGGDPAMPDPPQRITIAKFANPGGLVKAGQSLYTYAPAAGEEAGMAAGGTDLIGGDPGANGRGTIIAGALEMSNVELAQEFTEMIITQRGFQANAKTITTSDEMLHELVNLKR